jgi:hypothetical protein
MKFHLIRTLIEVQRPERDFKVFALSLGYRHKAQTPQGATAQMTIM